MKSIKGFVMLFVVFSAVVVLSNMITAKYIEDKVINKIGMEIDSLSNQIRQIQPNASYSRMAPEEKWNEVMAPTELSQYLDIQLDQVYIIIDDKESEIPYILIEGSYRFSKDAIDEWLASRKIIIGESLIY